MGRKLRVLLVGGPMYDPLYERIPLFEEQEGIGVEIAAKLPHPELNERIKEEFTRGEADYDLISTHTKYAPSQAEWLTPLDEDLREWELGSFAPRTLELARIEGRLYGIPRNLDVKLLYYRTDLLEGPPATWEELRDKSVALRKENLYGFVFPGRESGLFGHFFELHAMYGGRMFMEEDFPIPHINDEAGREALILLKDLYEKAAPEETLMWHYDEVAACFREGKAAMTTDWPGGFYTYEAEDSKIKGRYDVALYPEGPAGRYVYSGCHTFAIPTTTKDREASLSLLRFLASRESQAYEAGLGTLLARTDALEDAKNSTPPNSLSGRRWHLLEATIPCAIVPPRHPIYPEVEDIIWMRVREALAGEKSVERSFTEIEESAQRAMGSYNFGRRSR